MADFLSDLEDSDEEMQMLFEVAMTTPRLYREREDHLTKLTDEEFFVRFRLKKESVMVLLNLVEDKLEYPTDRNKCLDPVSQLLLTLRFYTSGCMLVTVWDFCGVHKSIASRTIRKVSCAIASLREKFIVMPGFLEEIRRHHMHFYELHRFPRVIAAIDCTHIKILSPGGSEAETYRNRKGYFLLNVQTLFYAKLWILDIVARWPGSSHDQTIFNASRLKAEMEMGRYSESVILGDSGYGVWTKYLMTPIRNPMQPAEHLFNESLIRSRNVVERQYGMWKGCFPVLSVTLRLSIDTTWTVVVACAVLHNMVIKFNEEEPPNDPDVPYGNDDEMNNLVGMDIAGNHHYRQPFITYFEHLTRLHNSTLIQL